MTNISTLTISQVRALSTEAFLAGDQATVADCATLVAAYDAPDTLDMQDVVEAYPEQAARVVSAIRDAEAQR